MTSADDGGISRLKRRLDAIPRAAVAAALPAVIKSAEEMAATMKRMVPVESGQLKASIEVTPAGRRTPPYSQPGGSSVVPDNAAAVTVGNEDVRYAHLVEYGTKKAPAHPFFWPAVRLNQKKSLARIKRAVGKAVREAK